VRSGLVIYGSLAGRSGGYLYDRMLVAELRRRKHWVEIISLPWRNYVAHLSDNFSTALVRHIRAKKLDLLVQDELNHPSLFLLNRRLKRELGIPIVAIVHHLRSSEQHPALLNAANRAIERRYLRSVDGFVFNSRTTRRVVRSLLGRLPRHVVAQPAGDRLRTRLSAAALPARAAEAGPLRVVFLGSLIRRKAPHLLLDALRQLPHGAVSVTFAGGSSADPAYARQLKAAARGLPVRFTGHLGEAQLARLLRTSQVLALPSSYEGYGIAYLEGMGFGLPAIGARAGAASELITHGQNGYLIRLDDATELAGLLVSLHRDRRLLVRLGKGALRRFAQHSTWRQSMAKAADFLSSYNP
jgi:glycosyltransferase involved in cell wall biosynthesis